LVGKKKQLTLYIFFLTEFTLFAIILNKQKHKKEVRHEQNLDIFY